VRVAYEKGFHIDLVAYSVWEKDGRETFCLAHKSNGWRPADPPALIRYVDDYREKHFQDTEDSLTGTDQFRRCVRYLRRWNDVRLPRELDGKPTGLALVVLAIQRGVTGTRFVDRRSDDLRCLHVFCQNVASTVGRLKAVKPTPENEDLFGRLSDKEMATLIADFGTLRDTLRDAGATSDPVVACRRLQEVFGDDFPVPDPEDTAKKTGAPAIIRSSTSA